MLRSASDQHQGIKSNQSSTAYNKIKCFYEQFIQYKSLKCIKVAIWFNGALLVSLLMDPCGSKYVVILSV